MLKKEKLNMKKIMTKGRNSTGNYEDIVKITILDMISAL